MRAHARARFDNPAGLLRRMSRRGPSSHAGEPGSAPEARPGSRPRPARPAAARPRRPRCAHAHPCRPSTSPSSSLAPLTTPGWPVKSGAEATKPTTFTTRSTRSRSPTIDFTAASAFSAQVRASSLASSARDLGADLAGHGELAVHHGQLAGGVHVRPGPHGRHVRGQRRHDLGQGQSQVAQGVPHGALTRPSPA